MKSPTPPPMPVRWTFATCTDCGAFPTTSGADLGLCASERDILPLCDECARQRLVERAEAAIRSYRSAQRRRWDSSATNAISFAIHWLQLAQAGGRATTTTSDS